MQQNLAIDVNKILQFLFELKPKQNPRITKESFSLKKESAPTYSTLLKILADRTSY